MVVGAPGDDDGATNAGALWVLFLNADGTVKDEQRISESDGNLGLNFSTNAQFGSRVANAGDFDGDGVVDLVVTWTFGTYLLFLDTDGTVKSTAVVGLFNPGGLGVVGDVDGDEIPDFAVGNVTGSGGGAQAEHVRVGFPNAAGLVQDYQDIAFTYLSFPADPGANGEFGAAVAAIGDRNGDDVPDLLIGSALTASMSEVVGSVWVAYLQGVPPPLVLPYNGCDTNPVNSLSVLSGEPLLDTVMTFGVDNPLGTQSVGSVPILAVSLAPDPSLPPCGTMVTGWGMSGPGEVGEALVSFSSPNPIAVLSGDPWQGPGVPAPVALPIPDMVGLVGVRLYVQGLMFDQGAPVEVGAASAVELRLSL